MRILVLLFVCLSGIGTSAISRAENKEGIIFATYNVRNYLGQNGGGSSRFPTKPKSESEKDALMRVIRDINPDILGICEMGSEETFKEFQERLRKAGLDYKHFEWLRAADNERHLALVSRFPIVSRQSQKNVRFTLNGKELQSKRGILDVTIQINPDYQLRCVGVHFKSKLPVPEGEALIRRHEAMKLRQYLDGILRIEPNVNLICYGDFNDNKNEPMFAEVTGIKGTPGYMADLWAKDLEGDRWTHYWRTADQYARFDYLFVSRGLWPEVRKDSARVYRSPFWFEASDHRPVYTTIFPGER